MGLGVREEESDLVWGRTDECVGVSKVMETGIVRDLKECMERTDGSGGVSKWEVNEFVGIESV